MSHKPKLFTPRQPPEEKRDGIPPYVYTDDILIAVDVALATQRPLLVSGPPGAGKSTLAANLAYSLDWRYLPQVITSRTRVEHLTGELDALRRLYDAQAAAAGSRLLPEWAYLKPGVFWWAFDPEGAARRGGRTEEYDSLAKPLVPLKAPGRPGGMAHAVLLLDEIDKAEPDVPNDLLEPLDRRSFTVLDREVRANADLKVLMVITTNGERELPPAFLRRCVRLELQDLDKARLLDIARHHFGPDPNPLHDAVADKMLELREQARRRGVRPPSTSEYLDTLRACQDLGVTPKSRIWRQVAESALFKHDIE